MRRFILPLCLAFAGCAAIPPQPSTGYLPSNALSSIASGQDQQTAALDTAGNAFAHPQLMHGRPAAMALAIACLDAIAGQYATGGRFAGTDDAAKLELLTARDRVRASLGISGDADSQAVINHMLAAAQALTQGDTAAASAALTGPIFTLPPAATLLLLNRFPYVPIADRALLDAQDAIYPQDGGGFGGDN